MSALLAFLPVLVAITVGIAIGLLGGGNPSNLLQWRPAAWPVAAGAIALQIVADVFDWTGVIPFILGLASVAALLYVSWMNRRIGGMVLVAVGLAMNLVPMLVNGGTPVSADAMVSAGALDESQVGSVELTGPRHLATSKDLVRPLGAVIPLPFGLVISFGDLVSLLGVTLVTQAVLRRRQVRAGGPAPPARNPRVTLSTYQEALQTLGQGPADNTYGVDAEHVSIGSSGNVRPVPMRAADSPASLDMAGPRTEGGLEAKSPGDGASVTVRPVPRRETSQDSEPSSERSRRRVVPPQGDIRPAPSGLDPDTGESAIVGISSLPPRDSSSSEATSESGGPEVPDDLPPGWSRAVDQHRGAPGAEAPYSYPSAAPGRAARPGQSSNDAAQPDEPTAGVPVADAAARLDPMQQDAPGQPAAPQDPVGGSPSVKPSPPASPRPEPVAPANPARDTSEPASPPEPGTRPGGVRRRAAQPVPGASPGTPEPTPTSPPEPSRAPAAKPIPPATDDSPYAASSGHDPDDADLPVIDESSPTGEQDALNRTQATPVVSPEDTSPGRWKVPASARGRRPRREPDPPSVDGLPATGEVPSRGSD